MEQNTQPQSQKPKCGKNKITVVALIATIAIVTGVYFWTTNNTGNNKERQNAGTQNQSAQSSVSDNVSAEINPRDYSLVEYPLKQSPAYSQFNCNNPKYIGSVPSENDIRLVKNNTEIIIPSLIQIVSAHRPIDKYEFAPSNCSMIISMFFLPTKGKYLYLGVNYIKGNSGPNIKEFDQIYRLDLPNLSAEITPFVFNLDEYDLLPDEKRIVSWDMDGIYLSNLETNSTSTLYTAPQNQSLISSTEVDEGSYNVPWAIYDIKIDKNQVTFGVYDKTKTQDGKPITISVAHSGIVNLGHYNNMMGEENAIKLKLINRIIIPIPVD